MALVKGGTEIFTIDFAKGSMGYCQLNSPIVAVSSTESVKTIISFHVLFDVGPFFVYGEIVAKDTNDIALTFSRRFIEKDKLSNKSKIMTFYDPINCKWKNSKDEDPGLILHFVDCLQQVNLVKYNCIETLEEKFKVGEIINLNGTGLIFGKRGDKNIQHLPVPLQISDPSSFVTVYKSHDNIRSIRFNFEGVQPYIYLSEGDNYIKKFNMVRTESTNLLLLDEFFVYDGFDGRSIYKISNGMFFQKNYGVRIQVKDPDGEQYNNINEEYRPNLDLDESTIDDFFPLISQEVLLFCGKCRTRSKTFKPTKAIILPAYDSPLFRLLPNNMSRYLRNEFYFYPKSVNEEFIVYRLNRTDINAVEFAFYRPNGKYESSIRLKIHGMKNYKYANVSISPNGKYVFYVEENEDYDEEAALQASRMRNTRHTIKTTKIVGRVSEIISLRPKRDKEMIQRLKKQSKKLKGRKFQDKLQELVNLNDVTFSLKPIRSVSNVGNTFSIIDDPNKDLLEESSRLFVTNYGDVIFLDKISEVLYFNNINLWEPNKHNFGYVPDSKDRNTISTLDWAFSQKGAIGYTKEDAYFVGIKEKRGKFKAKSKKIDFKINKKKLKIQNIHGCPDPNFILITLSNEYDEIIFLVWDLIKNCERYNYSITGDYSYISKPDSTLGVILSQDFYINLDIGLINYYFDHDFSTYPWTDDDQGWKMDKNEQTVLYKGRLLMKETYSECETLQALLDGRMKYDEKNQDKRFSDNQMMMQVDGNTILHLYAIDAGPLSRMLEYIMYNKKYMLTSILMKNYPKDGSGSQNGLTPIDVALKFESKRTVNLLFKALSELKDGSYSRLIYEKFNKLISMGLVSFHEYLDSCYFQTIQMKGINFLNLKDDNFDDYTVIPHSSCLIDEIFMKKYTTDFKKKKKEPSKVKEVSSYAEGISEGSDANGTPSEETPPGFMQDEEEKSPNRRNLESQNSQSQILENDEAFVNAQLSEDQKETHEVSRSKSKNQRQSEEVKLRSTSSYSIEERKHGETNEPIIQPGDVFYDEEEENEGGVQAATDHSPMKPRRGLKQAVDVQSPDASPSVPKIKNKQERPAYDPHFSIYKTEQRMDDDSEELIIPDPYLVDDMYLDNIRADDTQIRQERTKRLVPPRQVNFTEQDERRLKEFEKQHKIEQALENMGNQKIQQNRDEEIKELDFENMTKDQKEKFREKERLKYYRENMRNKMQVLDIYAIEFDWIFGKDGGRFLKYISRSESIELFSLEIIRIIISFFWQYYKNRIAIVSLFPFLLYFSTFLVYATYIANQDHTQPDDETDWNLISFIFKIVILVLSAYHLFLEALYLNRKYFKSFWNLVNLMTIGLAVASCLIDYFDWDYERNFAPVAACGTCMMWLKLFYFGRIINSTSTIVRMIIEISKDMVPFLVILILFLVGFANSFFIIAQNNGGDERFTSNNFMLAIMWTWINGLGEFDTDSFYDLNDDLGYMAYVIWILCTFMILIVFFNLLIAVLSDSFDKIQETLENNLYKEMAIMMAENEVFINRKKLFKDIKYLFIIKKVMQTGMKDKWGGRLDYVNKIIKKTSDLHFHVMDQICFNLDHRYKQITKERLMKFQQRTDKSFNHMVDKIDKIDSCMKIYKQIFEVAAK